LDENGDESLERSAHRTVDDYRPMCAIVLADVGQVEPLGVAVVELNGAELPGPADRVEHVEIDLRTIKRAVAGLELVLHAGRVERRLERRLGAVPHLVRPDAHLGSRSELELRDQAE